MEATGESLGPPQGVFQRPLPPSPDSIVELVEHVHCRCPVYTGIGDADSVLQALWTFLGDILATAVDVGLDHDTGYVLVTGRKLGADGGDNLGLVVVVLLRVAV